MPVTIIPAIDLRGGRCVRLRQGRKDNTTVYDGDPTEIAKSYQASGAQMIHIVDLDSAFSDSNSRNRQVLREIVYGISIPVQLGGGMRTREDVAQVLDLGVARVVIGTMAVETPERLDHTLRSFGAERIVVGIDARDGQVLIRGWEREGKLPALELARRVRSAGVERIVYTDVARDGMLTGINVEQTCAIAQESGLKVTASGGVSSVEDIERLLIAGVAINERRKPACSIDSVIIGKALYEGRFTLEEAIKISESESD